MQLQIEALSSKLKHALVVLTVAQYWNIIKMNNHTHTHTHTLITAHVQWCNTSKFAFRRTAEKQ